MEMEHWSNWELVINLETDNFEELGWWELQEEADCNAFEETC